MNGANIRLAARNFGSLSDRALRGEASYLARSEAASRAFAANENAFRRVPAVHHVAISGTVRTAGNQSGLSFIVYLRPGSCEEDAADLPREIRARRIDGSDLGYSFPVEVKVLPGKPVVFALSGGDSVTGSLRRTCFFAFRVNNDNYFITNSHVICDPGQNPKDRVLSDPRGTCHKGITLDLHAVNTLDVAVVQTSGTLSNLRIRGLEIEGREDPYEGSEVEYFYFAKNRKIDCVGPSRLLGTATAELEDGAELTYAGFWELETRDSPEPGDSGAALCRRHGSGLLVVGIVFGGIEDSNVVWAYPASAVWREVFK